MTTAQNVANKAAVGFVAAAMFFSMIAPAAQAQSSTTDLQKTIADLTAQLAALKGGSTTTTTTTTTTSGVCPYTWTRDLKTGSNGADVMKLQQFLNSDADTRVAATGAGSAGMETMVYGPATAAAVSKMQMKYRAEILTPAGLVNPTGFFGPSSRAVANSKCVAAPASTGTTTTTTGTTPSTPTDLSGEASLDKFEVDSASDDTVEEGDEEAEIGVFTVKFNDGDAEISRLDVALTKSVGDAWDAFDSVQLSVDGKVVAEVDASSKDDYLGDEDDGIIRFANLKLVAEEDEELEITVSASMQDNLDSAELGTWTIGADSMRFFDADGVATTEDGTTVTSDTDTFTIEVAGADDEILVKASSNDPKATTIPVKSNKASDMFDVFAFDIDTDDSTNDIDINEVVLTVSLSTSTYNNIVDDAELTIDGEVIDDVTVTNGASSTATLTFNVDGDVVINAGDRVEAMLALKFKSLSSTFEGTTFSAAVASGKVTGEGAEDEVSTGASTGETHTLRTQGIKGVAKSKTSTVTTADGATNDYATYNVVVEVTAFEQDVYISKNVSTALSYTLENGSTGVAFTATSSPVMSSNAKTSGNYYLIADGETKTVTLEVTYLPGVAGASAQLQLLGINFAETGVTPNQTWSAVPAEDYQTDPKTIVN